MSNARTRRVWPAWLVGALAGVGTLVAIAIVTAIAFTVSPGNEGARAERITAGGARLALFVGFGTGLVVHFRRKKTECRSIACSSSRGTFLARREAVVAPTGARDRERDRGEDCRAQE
jgi:hypothetical protein